ncbi:MAG: efflux RND transporter periplasmic adaptor subunit, partial [Pseudomonadota bacterium]
MTQRIMMQRILGFCLFTLILLPATWSKAEEDHNHDHGHSDTIHDIADDHADGLAHENEMPLSGHEGHAHVDEHGHAETNHVELNKKQRLSAGIVVQPVAKEAVAKQIEAPGEIRLNTYVTSQVTPRIQAQLVKRHAHLGDRVSKGQPLVTLSSVSMAEAQGKILEANSEWKRVKKLGRKVVSERRFQEAQINLQLSRARLLAYGMPDTQIDLLIQKNKIDQANGQFTLLAPQAGTVIQDHFFIGQMAEPGTLLFEITDESKLWVEARVTPESVSHIERDTIAKVLIGNSWIDGRIIQEYHALDQTTRTLAVRLEISNPEDHLHPGQFVTVRMPTGKQDETALSLPSDAVLRSPDGDWVVFVEQAPGEYAPKEVRLVEQLSQRVLIEGL